MKLPADRSKIYVHPLAKLWFDADGILHKVSTGAERSPEAVKDLYSFISSLTKGKKVCALIEVTNERVSDRDTRECVKEKMPEVFNAVAFIAKSPLGRMIGTLSAVIAPSNVPAQVFTDEGEARNWLRNYIHLC